MPHSDFDARRLSGLRAPWTHGVQKRQPNRNPPAAGVALGAWTRPLAVAKDAGFKPKQAALAREWLGGR